MGNVRIPTTQKGLIDLGKKILEKAAGAAKQTKVKFPAAEKKVLRKGVRLAKKNAALVEKHTEALGIATLRLKEGLDQINEAARSGAQILKQLLKGTHALAEFGYDTGDTMHIPKPPKA